MGNKKQAEKEKAGEVGEEGEEEMRRLCSWQWRAIIEHAANFRNICTQLSLLNTDCILRREWLFNLSPPVTALPFRIYISNSGCCLSDLHYTNAPTSGIRFALINDLPLIISSNEALFTASSFCILYSSFSVHFARLPIVHKKIAIKPVNNCNIN